MTGGFPGTADGVTAFGGGGPAHWRGPPLRIVPRGNDVYVGGLASGVYVCRVTADGRVQERKLVPAR